MVQGWYGHVSGDQDRLYRRMITFNQRSLFILPHPSNSFPDQFQDKGQNSDKLNSHRARWSLSLIRPQRLQWNTRPDPNAEEEHLDQVIDRHPDLRKNPPICSGRQNCGASRFPSFVIRRSPLPVEPPLHQSH